MGVLETELRSYFIGGYVGKWNYIIFKLKLSKGYDFICVTIYTSTIKIHV